MAWDALCLRSISIFSIQSYCHVVAGRLVTVRDAAPYITKLPKAEHNMPMNCRQRWRSNANCGARPQQPRPPDLYIRGRAGRSPPISPRGLKGIMTDKLAKKGRGRENNCVAASQNLKAIPIRISFHETVRQNFRCWLVWNANVK
jgi:hypothetical protein